MKAVLFDLDDTLFPELEFVRSGFRAAVRPIASRIACSEDRLFTLAWAILLRDGRGQVFDRLLRDLEIGPADMLANSMLLAYRAHRPLIQLYDDAVPTLDTLRSRGIRLGIITDGMASVQQRKIDALDLREHVDLVICTDEIGRDHWKPSTMPFRIALHEFAVEAGDAAYVGNDVRKDFIGPNQLGMLTVCVQRANVEGGSEASCNAAAMPSYTVLSLAAVLPFMGCST